MQRKFNDFEFFFHDLENKIVNKKIIVIPMYYIILHTCISQKDDK